MHLQRLFFGIHMVFGSSQTHPVCSVFGTESRAQRTQTPEWL